MGGRFAAISSVGLVPMSLIGMDLGQLLDRARTMARQCKPAGTAKEATNPGALLGAIVGDHVHTGINTSILPGRKLWPDTMTLPGQVVAKDVMR